jgi:hypothetical protein
MGGNSMAVQRLVCMETLEEPDPAEIDALYARFRALIGEIPGVESVRIGRNFRPDSGRYAHGAVIRFADKAALAAFGPHPNHVAVGAFLRPLMKSVLAVDFETAD